MAAEIHAAGTEVTREVARVTPGCWAIRMGLGNDGHIVVNRGLINGVARTVEAASHASGIITGYFDGRHFDLFGRPPGLAGFDQPAGSVGTLNPGDNVAWKLRYHPKSTERHPGYWCVDASGHVYAYGMADFHGGEGSAKGQASGKPVDINGTVDDFAPTPSGNGYAMISERGSFYGFGDATPAGDPYGDPHT